MKVGPSEATDPRHELEELIMDFKCPLSIRASTRATWALGPLQRMPTLLVPLQAAFVPHTECGEDFSSLPCPPPNLRG